MKKATILFALVTMCVSPLFSQYRHYSNDEQVIDYSSNYYRWGLYKNAAANQKITVTAKDKKSKIVSVNYEENFIYKDEQLNALENYSKGKMIRSYAISYN